MTAVAKSAQRRAAARRMGFMAILLSKTGGQARASDATSSIDSVFSLVAVPQKMVKNSTLSNGSPDYDGERL